MCLWYTVFCERAIKGSGIFIVSPEDLILSKLIWATDNMSEMQMKDVRNLFDSLKDLDTPYLMQWISSLGLHKIYEAVKR